MTLESLLGNRPTPTAPSASLPSVVSKFVPTPAQRKFVAAIHDLRSSSCIGDACQHAGISRATYYRWIANADFRIWLGNAWMGLLVADSWELINYARAKAQHQVGYWKVLYKLTVTDAAQHAHDWLAASAIHPADANLIPEEEPVNRFGPREFTPPPPALAAQATPAE